MKDSVFAGNVRTLPLAASQTFWPAALMVDQFASVTHTNVSMLIYDSTASTAVTLEWNQLVARVDQLQVSLCEQQPRVTVPSIIADDVSFVCTDAYFCSPQFTRIMRLTSAWTIDYEAVETAAGPSMELQMTNISFESLFSLMQSLSIDSSARVEVTDLRLVDSSTVSVTGWSINMTRVELLHLRLVVMDLGLHGSGI